MSIPTADHMREAHIRIQGFIHRTPILTCNTIDRLLDTELFFKCENLQKAGVFKIRGATNAVFSLSEADASRGVATHSSGNHGAALALAAQWRGIQATVVMPENSSQVKKDAVASYGAEIIYCESTLHARETTLAEVVSRSGATFVHPYNDPAVIAGQGTAALELLDEIDDLDVVITPVGGGGLLSGTSIAAKSVSPGTEIYGAEPENADDARRSLQAGKIIPSVNPDTIADGLLTSLGDLTFSIISSNVKDILIVSEEGIIEAMKLVWERMKIVIEPSSAVPLGIIMAHSNLFTDRKIGIILSGGNIDLNHLPW